MDSTLRIGIVGGNGWIGGALARTLVEAGLLTPPDLILSSRRAPPDWMPGAAWTHDNQALADAADVVVAAVRPQDWPAIDIDVRGKLVISVMAGVALTDIAAKWRTSRVVRALPNAAIEVRRSYTPWVAAPGLPDDDRQLVKRILTACGTEDEVPRESDLDYLAGHCGTGPAYPALLALAMMDDAVARGIPEAVARRAVVGILVGTGRLFERPGEDPQATVASFVNYRGITAAAIEAMQAGGLPSLVSAGLAAALDRSRAMQAASKPSAIPNAERS